MGWLYDLGGYFQYDIVQAIIILLVALLIAKVVLYLFKHVFERLAKHSKEKVDEKIVMRVETPIILVVVLVGIQLAIRQLLSSSVFIFESLINTIILFVITYMFIGVSNILFDYYAKSKEDDKMFHHEFLPLLRSLIKILLVLIAVIIGLQLWGVQVGALVASIGVIGIILGFAFKDTMANIFGGIALVSDNSIHKGDVIRLDTGDIGEVVEVNLRSTKIKTFDNDYLIVPNGVLANKPFHNLAQPDPVLRVVIPISVVYGSDISKVKKVLYNLIEENENILDLPKPTIRFMKMAEYSLNLDLIFYIGDYRHNYDMIDDMTTRAYNTLKKNNIEIPFPTRTVYNSKMIVKRKTVSKKILNNKKSRKKASNKKQKR